MPAPLFEIGPGSLRWDGKLLRAGDPVPDALLASIEEVDGIWTIPAYPNCTRPVVKTGLVVEGSQDAEIVELRQRVSSLETELAEAVEANRGVVKERSVLRGKLTRMEKKLAALEGDDG